MGRARMAIFALGFLPITTTAPGAAAIITSPVSGAGGDPRAWSIAERPRYVGGRWQCSPGLVWRNAGSTDWLCVDPGEALRIERENEGAPENSFDASDGSPGCHSGLVPRDAFRKDAVCVDPERRDAVRRMNAALYTVK